MSENILTHTNGGARPELLDEVVTRAAPAAMGLIYSPTETAVPTNENISDMIDAELQDDPNLRLEDLSADEQARLEIRVFGVNHEAEENGPVIARAMYGLDYHVSEGPLPPGYAKRYGGRTEIDRQNNLLARGVTPSRQNGEGEVLPRMTSSTRTFVETAQHDEQPLPIFRSIDVDTESPPPDPQYRTYAESMEALKAKHSGIFKRLCLDTSDRQREDLMNVTQGWAEFHAGRELTDIDQISVIAANAVRRHPDRKRIVVGVEVGAGHGEIANTVVEDTEVRSTLEYIPESARVEAEETDYNLIREMLIGEGHIPTEAELNRALLAMTIRKLSKRFLPEGSRDFEAAPMITQYVNQYFSDADVASCTETFDTIKRESAAQFPEEVERDKQAGLRMHQSLSAQRPDVTQLYWDIVAAASAAQT